MSADLVICQTTDGILSQILVFSRVLDDQCKLANFWSVCPGGRTMTHESGTIADTAHHNVSHTKIFQHIDPRTTRSYSAAADS